MNHSELAKEIEKLKDRIEVLEFYRENPSGYKMRIKEYPYIYCFRKYVSIDFVYNDKISSVELPMADNILFLEGKVECDNGDTCEIALAFENIQTKTKFNKTFLIDKENMKIFSLQNRVSVSEEGV